MPSDHLKVWHAIGPMEMGGAEVMIMELMRHKSADIDVTFLVHCRDSYLAGSAHFDQEIQALGGAIAPITTPMQSGVLAYLEAFKDHIAQHGTPDVIHIHLNARSGLVAVAAALHKIPRIIVHSHAEITFRGTWRYRILAQLELLISRVLFTFLATHLWACSKPAFKSLFLPFSLRKQHRAIVPNAINVSPYIMAMQKAGAITNKAASDQPRPLVIGTVGRIVRHKNVLFLIAVCSLLRRRGTAVELRIVGREAESDYADKIRAAIAADGLEDCVYLMGERGDIPGQMAGFDVFASPALKEGFGIVAIEAQAAGKACVLSTGFPPAVDMGLNLVDFVEQYDTEMWADAIMQASVRDPVDSAQIDQAFQNSGFSIETSVKIVEHAWRGYER
ncbi:glycosyltransferase [Altererythrobacter sp. RZ02]|uniref:Glycosyltransferase n=1 Tax=Pontixanthobacter rizhaonensis TaxID=2730337 RepID=A0A848QPS4_9SPHN|nr:glycosyltransferase [Pontixanthobacter rizhaonensis]NMW32597.1 glycosyltransferase [Pontixanthobacter rizhaonensis]